jgi:ElaB/YqjD/DUF883 family membrane-anchored ribosome-binding protein
MKEFGTKQAPVNASDLASIPAKVAEEVRRTVDSAYEDVSRNVRKAKRVAENAIEDVIDDSRREIKRRPFAAVGIAALAGLVTGLAIGWWAGYSTKD